MSRTIGPGVDRLLSNTAQPVVVIDDDSAVHQSEDGEEEKNDFRFHESEFLFSDGFFEWFD
ncbi:MAG: hypothetical protein KBB54_00010 [Candidatus Pacebacteria bacterium]|nr:hypothetical protein [Candidatus Paceibacterota bacterium]